MKTLSRDQFLTIGMTEGEAHLWRFCDAVDHGHKPNERDLQILTKSFRQILGGLPPKKALDLEKLRGRKQPTGRDAQPRLRIAIEVVKRMKAVGYEKAVAEVSANHFKSEKTVQRYYALQKRSAQIIVAMIEEAERKERKPADKK